jgi:hypothetical protein
MKRFIPVLTLCVTLVSMGVASAATGTPTTTPLPPPVAPGAVIAAIVGWVLSNMVGIGTVSGSVLALYNAVRAHQWDRLVQLAGNVAFNVATLANMDNATKRKAVEERVYAAAGPLARNMFSQAQFEVALESGYQLIAKPKTGS